MMKRRVFCYLCAALGVAAGTITAAEAAQSAGLTRSTISTIDGPSAGYHTVLVRVEIAPNFLVARHTHPGVESSYVLEGGGTLSVKGRDDQALKPGDGVQVPPETPHSFQNGAASTLLISTYVVEKDKPLASPAPE